MIINQKTKDLISGLDHRKFDVLEISGSRWENFDFNSCKSVSYPQFDICKNALDEKFDLIIAEQVFEHLFYPQRALRNVYSMLKDGGYFLITTPFLVKIHEEPNDCARWTETGLKYFLAECGFEMDTIKTGSWGNKECLIANLDCWVNYDESKHSLENNPDFPLVVWALAKK